MAARVACPHLLIRWHSTAAPLGPCTSTSCGTGSTYRCSTGGTVQAGDVRPPKSAVAIQRTGPVTCTRGSLCGISPHCPAPPRPELHFWEHPRLCHNAASKEGALAVDLHRFYITPLSAACGGPRSGRHRRRPCNARPATHPPTPPTDLFPMTRMSRRPNCPAAYTT